MEAEEIDETGIATVIAEVIGKENAVVVGGKMSGTGELETEGGIGTVEIETAAGVETNNDLRTDISKTRLFTRHGCAWLSRLYSASYRSEISAFHLNFKSMIITCGSIYYSS
mmetsp:Transcript_27171/g.43129  ORF Transcript_27171/g.43129 Transcript_27171/m.43129 type:complete len:112 (-) Transcript_27171:93-428(-)